MHHSGTYDERNAETARELEGTLAVIFGAGTMGSKIARELGRAGMNLRIVDFDVLTIPNLARTEANREFVGWPKALAVAETNRRELPPSRRIQGIQADALKLSDDQLRLIVDRASIVIGATANQELDRRLNRLCRAARVALVVPRLWPEDHEYVGDVLIVPWWDRALFVGCLGCVRPEDREAGPALEAQRGIGVEIGRVADLTAQIIIGLMLPGTPTHDWYARQLEARRNYFLVPRVPEGFVPVRTIRRQNCPDCTDAQPSPRQRSAPNSLRVAALAAAFAVVAVVAHGVIARAPTPPLTTNTRVIAPRAIATQQVRAVRTPQPRTGKKCLVYVVAMPPDYVRWEIDAGLYNRTQAQQFDIRVYGCARRG